MTDESSSSTPPESPPPVTTTTPTSMPSISWELPSGIEDDIEQGRFERAHQPARKKPNLLASIQFGEILCPVDASYHSSNKSGSTFLLLTPNDTHCQKTKNPLHSALVKATIGAVAGGVMGLIAFKGGKGTRAASIATGIGAGLGSTWERIKFRYEQQENK